eukprot:351479-Chlamydomonas_euryale.AAC.25
MSEGTDDGGTRFYTDLLANGTQVQPRSPPPLQQNNVPLPAAFPAAGCPHGIHALGNLAAGSRHGIHALGNLAAGSQHGIHATPLQLATMMAAWQRAHAAPAPAAPTAPAAPAPAAPAALPPAAPTPPPPPPPPPQHAAQTGPPRQGARGAAPVKWTDKENDQMVCAYVTYKLQHEANLKDNPRTAAEEGHKNKMLDFILKELGVNTQKTRAHVDLKVKNMLAIFNRIWNINKTGLTGWPEGFFSVVAAAEAGDLTAVAKLNALPGRKDLPRSTNHWFKPEMYQALESVSVRYRAPPPTRSYSGCGGTKRSRTTSKNDLLEKLDEVTSSSKVAREEAAAEAMVAAASHLGIIAERAATQARFSRPREALEAFRSLEEMLQKGYIGQQEFEEEKAMLQEQLRRDRAA